MQSLLRSGCIHADIAGSTAIQKEVGVCAIRKNEIFPIPALELQGTKLVQNPGY